MSKKIEILITLKNFISRDDLEGDINDICKRIGSIPQRLTECYPLNPEYLNGHRFEIEHYQECDYGSSSYNAYQLNIFRWETNDEMEKRIRKATIMLKAQKDMRDKLKNTSLEKDKKEYERLKKIFE